MTPALTIRPFTTDDDIEEITRIIRAAYAQLSAMGLKYWATWQEAADTKKRFDRGHGFVALLGDRVVGTITIYGPDHGNKSPIYRDVDTYGIGQFAIDPELQGNGYGKELQQFAEGWIRNRRGKRVALDTSEQATHLIAMYEKWGYTIAGNVDWRPFTNYLSVMMVKDLPDQSAT